MVKEVINEETYRVKDNSVSDHITNKTSLKDILRGKIELYHNFPIGEFFY
jgi:hypothetical protein